MYIPVVLVCMALGDCIKFDFPKYTYQNSIECNIKAKELALYILKDIPGVESVKSKCKFEGFNI